MKVCFTVDVEHDCPPFLTTYRGIEEGMPRLSALLAEEGVRSTLFITGDVAQRYPDMLRQWAERGHEIACHGQTHRPFDTLDEPTARDEIQASTATLRKFGPCRSFRAPNLRFPESYVALLEEAGYALDSSQAKYKRAYYRDPPAESSLKRVPASMTSSVLRIPKPLRFAILGRLASPAVIFVHPWEFVDFRRSTLRWDCRFRTGEVALACVRENLRFYRARGAEFLTMAELV
ncbi:MAG TPA: polysaccharide deacetylase family protein [Pirellulales bacterium]|jgi:peptidoglycan/xylan/chitin deacetylase (PgdA/CDA1 family)|nr:polysaccharide deacetylase family protein [Pirellulales bacterium]